MAPIYKREKTLGGIPAEPAQPYVQPTTPHIVLSPAEVEAMKPRPEEESELARAAQEIKQRMTPPEKPKPLLCFRDVLTLSRQNLADIFDRTVTGKVKVPILGDASVVENQITVLKTRIAEVEAQLATRSRRWQKYHRRDDMLSTDDLQRLQREEKKELKELQAKVRELQERLRTWGSHKEDFVGEDEQWIDMKFGDKHPYIILSETTPVYGWISRIVSKRVVNVHGGYDTVWDFEYCAGGYHDEIDDRYNIDNYRKLIELGPESIELTTGGMTWDNWTRWENAAIAVAITEGLIQPDLEIVSRHPGLARWQFIKEDIEEDRALDTVADHEEERKQALKTGGGSLGGARIYSRGWRYGKRSGKWTQRGIESFDETSRYRKNEKGDRTEYDGDAGSQVGSRDPLQRPSYGRGWTNDDSESYDPR